VDEDFDEDVDGEEGDGYEFDLNFLKIFKKSTK